MALAAIVGVVLWGLPLGEGWRLASYDSLFLFATRPVTNQLAIATGGVAIVFMDDNSFSRTGQDRSNGWDRARHAVLLNKLAKDRCPLVVFDVFFGAPGPLPASRDAAATRDLLESMKRLSNVVLMARYTNRIERLADGAAIQSAEPVLPLETFLDAAKSNWGVGNVSVDTNRDNVARMHWRFPSPGIYYDSLAWKSAKMAGADLSDQPQERWIRYYQAGTAWRKGAPWISLSYMDAEAEPDGFFRDKVVFIGIKPKENFPFPEKDKFETPLTDWTGRQVGGVEILVTEFLNLIRHEWLRRPKPWVEVLILAFSGPLLVAGFYNRSPLIACLLALGAVLVARLGGICLSYFTNYWFPWLIVAGAQVPLALAFPLWNGRTSIVKGFTKIGRRILKIEERTIVIPVSVQGVLELPDYELIQPPFGHGAYGQVWLARNAIGQWQAVKSVYRANFGEDAGPYEREFHGIERYKPVSDKHPGLLRIDFVSRMKPEGYFYYAMELGDAVTPGWESNPASYKPLDLAALCANHGGRLPPRECARIGARLCEGLQFLHSHGLAHRDIKPRNVIFVNGQPKLADVGLVANARRPAQDITWVGTLGFMPPEPETPGTPEADIYGLGMMLYVVSTGEKPTAFPELSTSLAARARVPEFSALSQIIFKACQSDRALRYSSMSEMQAALLKLEAELLAHEKQE